MATLRQVIEKMGDEWLDAEFVVRVYDGHRNAEHVPTDDDWYSWSRFNANMIGDGTSQFRLNVGLSDHRLVKARK